MCMYMCECVCVFQRVTRSQGETRKWGRRVFLIESKCMSKPKKKITVSKKEILVNQNIFTNKTPLCFICHKNWKKKGGKHTLGHNLTSNILSSLFSRHLISFLVSGSLSPQASCYQKWIHKALLPQPCSLKKYRGTIIYSLSYNRYCKKSKENLSVWEDVCKLYANNHAILNESLENLKTSWFCYFSWWVSKIRSARMTRMDCINYLASKCYLWYKRKHYFDFF